MEPLRAITVCVDYADYLSLTLPRNIQHFAEYWIVTSLEDVDAANLFHRLKDQGLNVFLVKTDRFYARGAEFNKWAGLELGLEVMERHGWLCVLDADVLLPNREKTANWTRERGCLYTPRRRMYADVKLPLPEPFAWDRYPLHPQQTEWAGYMQVFHANDPALGSPPWYETNWRHAGGADSFFQRKWPTGKKKRPPFEVLHLGPSGVNWCGRSSPYLNGDVDERARERNKRLLDFLAQRRQQRATGDPYRNERINSTRT